MRSGEGRALLRLVLCGSVDDGKSTLLGRLLLDLGKIAEDQMRDLKAASASQGTRGAAIDPALLLDGLAAEREQGITIDIAWRRLDTGHRALLIADAPGHGEYTRNMATAAAGADIAIVLIDATKGVLEQTARHLRILGLVGLRQVILAVNKMDLAGYEAARFHAVAHDAVRLALACGIAQVTAIPVVASDGDGITRFGPALSWQDGPTLLEAIDRAAIPLSGDESEMADKPAILPVQWVNRPTESFRGYCGTLGDGRIAQGQQLRVWPSGATCRIARIWVGEAEVREAVAGQPVTLELDEKIDIARGDVLAAPEASIQVLTRVEMEAIHIDPNQPLVAGRPVLVQLGTALVPAEVVAIHGRQSLLDGAWLPADAIAANEFGRIALKLSRRAAVTERTAGPVLGAFTLIDPESGATIALGTVPRQSAQDAVAAVPGGQAPVSRARLTRRFLEAVSWRLSSSALFGTLTFLLLGRLELAAAAAAGDAVIRSVLRHVHSRVWQRLRLRGFRIG